MRPAPTQPIVLSFRFASAICSLTSSELTCPARAPPANVCRSYPRRLWSSSREAGGELSRSGGPRLLPLLSAIVCRSRRGAADGAPHVRNDGRRLGGARPLRPPAGGTPGADLLLARRVGAGCPSVLRHDQHPLRHGDAHRYLGAGQAEPLLPAPPGRRADHVGLRIGRAAPPALQPVARRGSLARGHLHPTRR